MQTSRLNLEQCERAWLRLRPYLHICHLHRPVDLLLFLFPALWTIGLAKGELSTLTLLNFLLAATLVRCAAWVYNDLQDAKRLTDAPESFIARQLVGERDAWQLLIGLLITAAVLILPLGLPVILWGSAALVLLFGYPHIKHRTLLTQAYMGLCFAWIVPMSQLLAPELPAKSLWLLFTATLLWATANTLLYSIPRYEYQQRVGIGSLISITGDASKVLVLILQLFVVIALWFAGKHAETGSLFGLSLLAALAQIPYQQWIFLNHPGSGATRAYRANILFGLTILLGLWLV